LSQFGKGPPIHDSTGYKKDVATGGQQGLFLPEELPKPPFCPVSLDGIPDGLG
jgi:hypothetical protein